MTSIPQAPRELVESFKIYWNVCMLKVELLVLDYITQQTLSASMPTVHVMLDVLDSHQTQTAIVGNATGTIKLYYYFNRPV
jgi:hypothetical protein